MSLAEQPTDMGEVLLTSELGGDHGGSASAGSAVPQAFYQLEEWPQLALAAAMVARMAPNVALFCDVAGYSGDKPFNSALALVWEFAAGDNTSIDFERQREKLEAVIPDPEQFDMYGVWPALDGFVALGALLSACESFDPEEVASIFTLSQATIDGFIEATGQGEDGEMLYAVEKEFVENLLSVCSEVTERKAFVAAVKAKARAVTQSNIGISVA